MTAGIERDPLAGYEAMAEISGQMLGAARESDWDRFIAEEKRCRDLVADLQSRDLAEPWMMRLQDTLATSENHRRLGESYGSQP
jgi:hypothetical protein